MQRATTTNRTIYRTEPVLFCPCSRLLNVVFDFACTVPITTHQNISKANPTFSWIACWSDRRFYSTNKTNSPCRLNARRMDVWITGKSIKCTMQCFWDVARPLRRDEVQGSSCGREHSFPENYSIQTVVGGGACPGRVMLRSPELRLQKFMKTKQCFTHTKIVYKHSETLKQICIRCDSESENKLPGNVCGAYKVVCIWKCFRFI